MVLLTPTCFRVRIKKEIMKMTKNRSTKRALLASALSLVLCFTMLLGTTYAWFTDSVTSAGNIIKSGTLDVAMHWADGTKTVPANDSADWADASAGPIFNYTLWEPGYTQVRHIKIENIGTLGLKYQLAIEANGAVSDLSDVIDVYYTDPADQVADRTVLTNKLGTLTEVLAAFDSTAAGELKPGESHVVTLALKMQETAGNEYQDKAIGADFSVILYATQLAYEEDSFDENYDAGLDASANGIAQTLSDGSEAFYYAEDSDYFGRVRLTALPENVGTEYTVPAEVNDLGGALVGANLDKLTIPAGVEYAYKSLEGATIDEIVIEEGATTIPNRMFYKTNATSIEIPASVTTIEENAFAMTTVAELVVPASVTTVGEAAFQHMPNLTTVTFEGDVAIEGYAFRGCSNLRTVYLKGENTTFVVSASGKNSCWFCNGESNNPNTSNITFYVENDTVAANLRTALGAEKPETTPIYVNGVLYNG